MSLVFTALYKPLGSIASSAALPKCDGYGIVIVRRLVGVHVCARAFIAMVKYSLASTIEIQGSGTDGGADVQSVPLREVEACVSCAGSLLCSCLCVFVFLIIFSWVPVAGLSDAPRYAQTLLYLSVAHHFDDVQEYLGRASPPPPPAF